jgi:excisionase family DNA binding protein
MVTQIPQTLPIDAVADRLGVSGWTVRTWLRQGRIPFVKLGRRVLVKVDDVEALLAKNYQPATRPADGASPPTKQRKAPRPA